MPIVLTNVMVYGFGFAAVTAKHFEFIFFGGLIIFFLIVEPHGIARLWQIAKEKLRLWPFPH
jgi:branched-chain amino acid transport system permease protein